MDRSELHVQQCSTHDDDDVTVKGLQNLQHTYSINSSCAHPPVRSLHVPTSITITINIIIVGGGGGGGHSARAIAANETKRQRHRRRAGRPWMVLVGDEHKGQALFSCIQMKILPTTDKPNRASEGAFLGRAATMKEASAAAPRRALSSQYRSYYIL